MKIALWPNGTWCEPDDIWQMNHLSDDYMIVDIPEGLSEEHWLEHFTNPEYKS